MDKLLEAHALSVGYPGKVVVEDIELTLKPGRIVTLIGPNGAGKSTILKTVTGALRPAAGEIALEGVDLRSLPERERAKRMAVLMTARLAPELLTCRDIVSAGRYPYTGRLGILSEEDRAEVERAMALTGVTSLADTDFTRVSDGERQLVLLARAVCQKPRVMVLDEPTSFLDIRHKLKLLAILKDLARRERVAVLMSLHELDLAEKVSDTVLCVANGRIQSSGPPEEIFTGETIRRLYQVERGCWNGVFSTPELEKPAGIPRVFVVGGGGYGIPLYRALQRRGVPFSAGILFENDVDLPVASALAQEVVTCGAFSPIPKERIARARAAVDAAEIVADAGCPVGTFNRANGELIDYARSQGKRVVTGLRELEEALL